VSDYGDPDDFSDAVDAEVLVELTQAVWASFVDDEVPLLDLGPCVPGPEEGGVVVGSVTIDGPSPTVLTVSLPAQVASQAAARMFDIDVAAVVPADVHDATGEIANMIGGNVKAMFGGEHRLGLPSVTDGATGPDPDEALASATLLWGEHALLVTLDRAPGGSTP
jgi:chemotaxis protein CheX